MTVNTKNFEVNLTEREVEVIATALHKSYRPLKDEHGYSNAEASELRELRNAFAGLVNRHYMGEDA